MEKLGRTQKWICGIVLMLGVVSAVLGFVAETKRIKGQQIEIVNGVCIYPSSAALILGVVAAMVLLVAQIIINVAGGCICCTPGPPGHSNSPSSSNRSIAVICLVACWITFLNAFALLMAGASLNKQRSEYMWSDHECHVVKPLVFAGGALLSLATVVLGLIFYLAASSVKAAANSNTYPPTIALGQPAYGTAYPPYGPPQNAQAYQYTHYPQYVHPPPQHPDVPPQPYPAAGFPDVVTGYPKRDAPQGSAVSQPYPS